MPNHVAFHIFLHRSHSSVCIALRTLYFNIMRADDASNVARQSEIVARLYRSTVWWKPDELRSLHVWL